MSESVVVLLNGRRLQMARMSWPSARVQTRGPASIATPLESFLVRILKMDGGTKCVIFIHFQATD